LFTVAVVAGVPTALVPAAPAVAAAPAVPSPRLGMGMAYDAARGQAVLFGGETDTDHFGDTWTWDGTDWAKPSPAHSPSRRVFPGMAYDVASGQVVLFGGLDGAGRYRSDTWTWDGTDWTERFPAHSPSPRYSMGMTYDAARDQVVLFGGASRFPFADTWTWDGTDWTERSPVHSSSPRYGMGMAYDAARSQVVLFGGNYGGSGGFLRDTWTWDGTDWAQHIAGSLSLEPKSGKPTFVQVKGYGFAGGEKVKLAFIDSAQGRTFLGRVHADATGAFTTYVVVPGTATLGLQHILARGLSSDEIAKRGFTVEP
jgi:hypothetical protein